MTEGLRAGVLFDVDGTLVDTNYLHTLAWSRAFRDAGEWAPMNAIHRLIGMGGDRLVTELLGHECAAAVEARPHHYKELVSDIRVFPQAAVLLRALHNDGLAVVLATSAPTDELEILRKAIDADDVIDGQTTSDDVGKIQTVTRSLRDCYEDLRYRPSICPGHRGQHLGRSGRSSGPDRMPERRVRGL